VVDEHRFKIGQLINLVLFPLIIAAKILTGPKPDIVMCSTAPQVTLGFAVSWAARRRGAKFLYHCMDLQPEIGQLSGDFENRLVYRALLWADTKTMQRATRVVVLSEDMRQAVSDRDTGLENKLVVLNNFALPDFDSQEEAPGQTPYQPRPGALTIVFTGNIGRFQRLDEVIEALSASDVDVDLVFMGEGKALPSLRVLAGEIQNAHLRVTFLQHGSPRQARALMGQSDLGLVSLAPGVVRYAYPSKTATYLCEGLPVLIYCESDSQLFRTVAGRGVGWSASTSDELAAAVTAASRAFSDQGGTEAMTDRVRQLADEEFAAEIALDRWVRLLDDVRDGITSHV
jgi:glycosyltransferase involved in cell wall biosynthesis